MGSFIDNNYVVIKKYVDDNCGEGSVDLLVYLKNDGRIVMELNFNFDNYKIINVKKVF